MKARIKPSGFTLIEMMIVIAISVMLVGISTYIYLSCMRIYRESQGVLTVYQTSRLINKDMRAYLEHIVPVRGSWIEPQVCCVDGVPEPPGHYWDGFSVGDTLNLQYEFYNGRFGAAEDGSTLTIPGRLLNSGFIGPLDHQSWHYGIDRSGGPKEWGKICAGQRFRDQGTTSWGYEGAFMKDWWMPTYYGVRDGTDAHYLETNDVTVSPKVPVSWYGYTGPRGWPRADYRMDADADKLARGSATIRDGANIACWFYAESNFSSNPYSLALDNPNVVLFSIKFTMKTVDNHEETHLSFINHHITGFDHSYMYGEGKIQTDAAYGNMMRAFSIVPYYLDATGHLKPMDDAELGCKLVERTKSDGPNDGNEVPRCFDVSYRLKNPSNEQQSTFSFRVYCETNPQ